MIRMCMVMDYHGSEHGKLTLKRLVTLSLTAPDADSIMVLLQCDVTCFWLHRGNGISPGPSVHRKQKGVQASFSPDSDLQLLGGSQPLLTWLVAGDGMQSFNVTAVT